jgi:thiosulfate reductase cytochrome b subunit
MRKPQPWPVRITHWLTVPALLLMAMSGLQIFVAYPHFGPAANHWPLPFDGWIPPEAMRSGHGLAAGRGIHFLVGWFLVGNGLAYVVYLFASSEFRRRLFWPPRDTRPMIQQALYYLRIRKQPPAPSFYNGLQRSAYTGALALGILEVWSGLVIYKPVQLHALGIPLGGYDGARMLHFFGLVALAAFVVVHLILVALHPRALAEMITGGKPRE